jgi:lipid II isoglutaminyl synthase (glutamine-hydrolysing)
VIDAPADGVPPVRARLASRASTAVSAASRRLRLGGGSVIGGRVGLLLDPDLLARLAAGRRVALVSATNGKTTTTRLLAAALGLRGPVASSGAGANMPSGLVSALAGSPPGRSAVLEVDEGYLGAVAAAVHPEVVALLNLSRDQLDRVSEVRMVAGRWRAALAQADATTVVANADDPLVVWGAERAPRVVWVAAGQLWRSDAVGCPACSGRIVFAPHGDAGDDSPGRDHADWRCACGFRRPVPDAALRGSELVTVGGRVLPIRLALPGRCNRANAGLAAVAAGVWGVDEADALAAMGAVSDVEGRFATVSVDGVRVRLLLAKNPAGWMELLDLLEEEATPVAAAPVADPAGNGAAPGPTPAVVGINARVADGHDPSWLWDVPFERLAGRVVVATGERCHDLAVRLRHAGVAHLTVADELDALRAAGSTSVEFIGNYTAFQILRRRLARGAWLPRRPPAPAGARLAPPGTPVTVVTATPDTPDRPQPHRSPPRTRAADAPSALRVVVVHPDLLGTYGDGGNGAVLAGRAAWRGMAVELVHAPSDVPLPRGADVYCLGGGEDGPQVQSAERLRDGALARAVDGGAAVLAVCAGYQVLGHVFPGADGQLHPGVGLLDVTSAKGHRRRAVGELLTESLSPAPVTGGDGQSDPVPLDTLTGFENHGALTRLGPGVRPLARVLAGVGNGIVDAAGDAVDGARAGKVIGTYLHGPALARNPALADLLLAWATGTVPAPLDDEEEQALRAQRLAAVGARGWRHLLVAPRHPLVRVRSPARARQR